MSYMAECHICKQPISWQEIHSGDACKSDEGVAHRECISGDAPDETGGDDGVLGGLQANCPMD